MKRALTLAVVVVAALGALWGCSEQRLAALEHELERILAIEDAAQRSEEALAFVTSNAEAPEEASDVLGRALDTAVGAADEAGGQDAAFEVWEKLYAAPAIPERHGYIVSMYDRALVDTDDPEHVARAEEIARDLLADDDAAQMPHIWLTWFHSASELTDKELTVDVALAGHARSEEGTEDAEMWPSMLDTAYGALLGQVAESDGLEAAVELAKSRIEQTDDHLVRGVLQANIYRLAIEDEPDVAIEAVHALAASKGFTGWDVLNNIAHDMTQREIEFDTAARMAERSVALASSAFDSTMALDTAGWAQFKAGNNEKAVAHLEKALSLMQETPASGNATVDHLIQVYQAGGMEDRAIDFLTMLVARSVDADDPARGILVDMLVARDGSAAALDGLIAEKRYDGVTTAPAFSLPNRGGETVALADFKGDVVMLAFWGFT